MKPHIRMLTVIFTLLTLASGRNALAAGDSNLESRLVAVKDSAGLLVAPSEVEAMLDNAARAGKPLRYTAMLQTAPDYDPFRIGADAAFEAEYRNRSSISIDVLSDELATRAAGSVTEVARLLPLPIVVVEADVAGLRVLIESPLVQGVYSDITMQSFLHETLPIIETASLDAYPGVNGGVGQTIAVLDSGVQLNHPSLLGKIVGQACFASGYPGIYSACPTGHNTGSTQSGAGATCTAFPQCDHGTHVSAIAVGHQQTTTVGPIIRGVALSASLVAVRVGSLTTTNCRDGSTLCVGYQETDTAQALAWLFSNRDSLNLAVVNMSYGWFDSSYDGVCDTHHQPTVDQIAMLTGAGIAMVAASGNEGWNQLAGRMAFPACASHVIAVGAVDKNEQFAPYTNASSMLDLLAPGGIGNPVNFECTGTHQCVLSASANSAYKYDAGTSMAAPHVSGAIAALRNVWPKSEVGVDVLLQRLQAAGAPKVFYQASSEFTVELLKLDAALIDYSDHTFMEPILTLILGE